MRTYSCKTNKLRNVITIGGGVSNISINNWKINYFKVKALLLISILVETMPFVMDKSKAKKGFSI